MKEWKTGGCHCGAVRFEAKADWSRALLCNCSMCAKKAYLHVIAEKEDFRLKQGEQALTCYQFGTKTAKHLFCRICGITSYYVPRSHPNSFSVNARCVEGVDPESLKIEAFDGKNWEAAKENLRD